LLANRDEFFERPTTPLKAWADGSGIVAGRDVRGGGTWLGAHAMSGRVAVITNVREPGRGSGRGPRSRGLLVTDFLNSSVAAMDFAGALHTSGAAVYEGYNLLLYDGSELVYYSNRGALPQRVAPGVHALSNAALNTPWPKVQRVREGLAAAMATGATVTDMENLFRHTPLPDDADLPKTGVPLAWERKLGAVCIDGDLEYGTRALTSVQLSLAQGVQVREWSRDSVSAPWRLAEARIVV